MGAPTDSPTSSQSTAPQASANAAFGNAVVLVPGDAGDFLNPLALGGGGAALLALALAGGWWVRARRRRILGATPPALTGLAARLAAALSLSRSALAGKFDVLFASGTPDSAFFDELEEVLLTADVGVPTSVRLLGALRGHEGEGLPALRVRLRAEMRALLESVAAPLVAKPQEGPLVILVVGVNGSGKTTTIGKLAARYRDQGLRVMLAAGDTYRAAAAEQLTIWAERAGADIVAEQEGADPASVAYRALEAGKARGADVVIIDTAGRLQTKAPLMAQLSKIQKTIQKLVPDGPHETLLVLDGTMGQNAISQAQLFHESTPLTGAVVTKLDGTAKGGMILTIAAEMRLPIKLIGIGEAVSDLKDFEVGAFIDAIT